MGENHNVYSFTEKGLENINRIIRESPEYKKLIDEFLVKLENHLENYSEIDDFVAIIDWLKSKRREM